jgi:hypothetical protein
MGRPAWGGSESVTSESWSMLVGFEGKVRHDSP